MIIVLLNFEMNPYSLGWDDTYSDADIDDTNEVSLITTTSTSTSTTTTTTTSDTMTSTGCRLQRRFLHLQHPLIL